MKFSILFIPNAVERLKNLLDEQVKNNISDKLMRESVTFDDVVKNKLRVDINRFEIMPIPDNDTLEDIFVEGDKKKEPAKDDKTAKTDKDGKEVKENKDGSDAKAEEAKPAESKDDKKDSSDIKSEEPKSAEDKK